MKWVAMPRRRRTGVVQHPARRPIEDVARDVRRLRQRYAATRSGVSYAKQEAFRLAYDHALAEGCDALGITHLLGVLADGADLDLERVRVERLLHRWGLSLDAA